jgi:hypothetical protein
MKTRFALGLVLVSILLLGGCARTVATTWGYSSWYRRGGAGAMSTFETQRGTCLSELGVPDPTKLQPDSPQETQFLLCMNSAGWCTQLWNCNRPGGG